MEKILAIVVRYQMPLSQSPAVRGFCDATSSQPDLAESYTMMVWDNSPEPEANPQLPVLFIYHHSEMNLGVSGAYNGAMRYALEHGYTWMLLLDQDTTITCEFLSVMLRHSRQLQSTQEIAAIVPTVRCGKNLISPQRRLFSRVRSYPRGECGIASGKATAINSGCILRVASLNSIGGFSPDFWLDFSDGYVFHQFFVHKMKIWRAANIELEHDLSIMNYEHRMTSWRFQNLSSAEMAFADLYYSSLERTSLTFRLLVRAIKYRIEYENLEYSRIAWNHFMYRLRVPQTERIARWLVESKERVSQQRGRNGEMTLHEFS